MIRDEDAPRPRPDRQPTTSDRGAVDESPENDAVTTRRPSAQSPLREPTTKLAELGSPHIDGVEEVPAPRVAQPAFVTQMVCCVPVSELDAPVAPAARGGTEVVSEDRASLDRATVSLRNGAQWLSKCHHDRLSLVIEGMVKGLVPNSSDLKPLEYVGARLAADLRRASEPYAEEQIGTMLVQIARIMGVDPCTRTMRKIAADNEAKAKQYEARAAASGNTIDREKWLARANERRQHAIDLKKATR